MMRLSLLGTGSSTGVPQLLCRCPVCRSNNPRNRRTRFALLFETEQTTLLVDTPFEIRLQLLAAGVKKLDALWLTHAHSDHLAGIDDLRIFSFQSGAPIPFFALPPAIEAARHRFRYLFDGNEYTAVNFLDPHAVGNEPLIFHDLMLVPILHQHGETPVASFRVGDVAFLADISAIEPAEEEKLRGLNLFVVSCTVQRDHYKHMKLDDILSLVARLAPRRTILTHMNHRFDYDDLVRTLPPGIEPGYDGLTVTW